MSANGDKSDITIDLDSLTRFVLEVQTDALFFVVDSINNRMFKHKLKTLFLQVVLECKTDFFVDKGANSVGELHNCDL